MFQPARLIAVWLCSLIICMGTGSHATAAPVMEFGKAAVINVTPYLTPAPITKGTGATLSLLQKAVNDTSLLPLKSSYIVLNQTRPNGWFLLSIQNNSGHSRWWLDFGALPTGREGVLQDFGVYDLTNNRLILNALQTNPKRVRDAHASIYLPQGQTTTLALYLGTDYPRHFVSQILLRPDNILRASDNLSVVNAMVLGLLGAVAFTLLVIGLAYNPLTGIVSAAAMMMPLSYLVFFAAPVMEWAAPNLALGGGLWFMIANTLLFTAALLHARGGYVALSGLSLLMGVSSVVAILAAFIYGTDSLNVDVKILIVRFAPFIPLFSILLLCVHGSLRNDKVGRYGLIAAAIGVAAHLIGVLGTVVPDMPPFLVFAPWIGIAIQGMCFIRLLFAYSEAIFAERLRKEGLKLKEAEQLSRMKQLKEASDQARLMRVIEREREVMEELRVREAERSNEMRIAKDMADEANRAKSAFLAVVSHEIRTPMTGIMGMVRLLLDANLNGTLREYAETIKDSGDSMLALLNDILDFSKIENDHMELEDIEFDLPALVNNIVRLMHAQAQEKGITLTSELDNDLPRYVRGDPARLRQVILNLVNNAIKFTKAGGVTISLQRMGSGARANEAGEVVFDEDRFMHNISFRVSDTGIGISPEAQKNIFNPFSQAESSTTRKYGGTGLGLAICKRLVEAMGSDITIKSTPGVGTTFMFTIRMPQGFSDEAGMYKTEETVQRIVRNLNILVVEDNAINQRVIRELLERDNHTITIAGDGRQAVMMAHQNAYDAILMDDELPELSGGEATAMIREAAGPCQSIPIIGLTGNASREDVTRLRRAGMTDVLPKPIDPVALRNLLADIFDERATDEASPSSIGENTGENPKSEKAEGGSNAIPILDLPMLNQLRDTLGKDSLKDLIDSLLIKSEEIVGEIKKACENSDAELLGRKGHEIKGMAGNFGLIALSHAGSVLEKAGKTRNNSAALYIAEQMEVHLEDARKALGEYMGSH